MFLINLFFGNGVIIEGIGVLLNNEMDDFFVKFGSFNVYGLIGLEVNVIELGKCFFFSMIFIFMEFGLKDN